MTALVLLAGLVIAIPGALGRPAGWRLAPPVFAGLVTASLVASAGYVTAGLALLAAPAVGRLMPASAQLGACLRSVEMFEPGGRVMSWVASGLLASAVGALLYRAWRAWRARQALLVPPHLGEHQWQASFDLVTLPTPALLAYSIDGAHPQAVVSQGLKDRLGEAELAAVVAHEAAHLRYRHQRWLITLDAVCALIWFLPWAGRAARAARVAMECWADQDAVAVAGRDALRGALLVAAGTGHAGGPVAAFNGAEAVAERLHMLEGARRRPPRLEIPLIAVLSMGTIGAAAGAVASVPRLVLLVAHLCPL